MKFRKFLILAGKKFSAAMQAFISWVLSDGGTVEAKAYTDALLQTATNASILQIPSAYKAGTLYNQIPISPDNDDFTVARASDVWRTNEAGVLEVIGSNVPCIDYSDGFPVLLTQPLSTNLLTYSDDFSDAVWNYFDASATVNQSISPDGTQNADKFIEGTGASIHRCIQASISIVDTENYTFSVFAKAAERDFITLTNNTGTGDLTTTFDLTNGLITVGTGKIEDFGNGWFRCSRSFVATATVVSNFIAQLYCNNGSGISYQGDGISGVYIWGAQLENLSYPTSYIPTTVASATRLEDVITGAGSTASINSEEGVLFLEMAALADDVGRFRRLSLSDGTEDNAVFIGFTGTSGVAEARVIVGTATQCFLSTSGLTLSDFYSIAVKWKVNDFELYINGVSVSADVSGITFTSNTLTSLQFDAGAGVVSTRMYNKTKQLRVYSSIAEAQIDLPYIT